jgi:predicted helicase
MVEESLSYIYAILHAAKYRNNYDQFLKGGFPRIPFVSDRKIFLKLPAVGWGLMQAHLMAEMPATPEVDITKGSNIVEKISYDGAHQRLFINQTQYFTNVTREVSELHVGGYQVFDK